MEIVLNFTANCFFLGAYIARDILLLRVFCVCGALGNLAFYFSLPERLIPPMFWSALFISVHTYWIVRLIRERRPVQLSAEERLLHRLAFPTLAPQEVRKLLDLGTWEVAPAGETLIRRDETVSRLSAILSGKAVVKLDAGPIELAGGDFVGIVPFITDEPAPCDVVAAESIRYLTWKKDALNALLKNKPDLETTILRLFGSVLIRHLLKITHGGPHIPELRPPTAGRLRDERGETDGDASDGSGERAQ